MELYHRTEAARWMTRLFRLRPLGSELAAIRNDIRHYRVGGLCRNRSQRNEGCKGRNSNKRGRYCCPNRKSPNVHDILISLQSLFRFLQNVAAAGTTSRVPHRSVDDASTARYANPARRLPPLARRDGRELLRLSRSRARSAGSTFSGVCSRPTGGAGVRSPPA